MDSVVHSHHVYKSVWSSVIEQLGQSTWWICSGSDKNSQIVNCTPLEDLFTEHVIFYYTKGLCRPLSSVCHITERRRIRQGLEISHKYNYYYGSTKDLAFIRDQTFFVIILFPLATKQVQAFTRDQPWFKAIQCTTKELRNKVVLSLEHYCM